MNGTVVWKAEGRYGPVWKFKGEGFVYDLFRNEPEVEKSVEWFSRGEAKKIAKTLGMTFDEV